MNDENYSFQDDLQSQNPRMIADPDEVRPENSDDRMDGEMLFF